MPPHILFKIFVYAMSNGVYSTRMIQQQCEENINYMWLLQGYSTPSHMTFQRFFYPLYTRYLNESVFTANGSY